MKESIAVEVRVEAPIEKVWHDFTDPAAIVAWNAASSDWHTPKAENDLRVGGAFSSRMEAKDGSQGFDFNGVYSEVIPHKLIAYTMEGGREVRVEFNEEAGVTHITETFDPENENPIEMQRDGWQSILDNFKKYAEGLSSKS